jgi:hypothetical protein
MRAGISEPTRPDTARHSHCHLSVTTGPFSVSVLGPDEFSRLAALRTAGPGFRARDTILIGGTRPDAPHLISMTQSPCIIEVVSSRVTRGTWPDDGPATDLRHGANARR